MKASLSQRSGALSSRIFIAWISGLLVLALAGWVGDYSEEYWGVEGQFRYGLQAIVMAGLVVTIVWLLRTRLDKGTPKSIGVGNLWQAFSKFILGMSLIVLPVVLTIGFTMLFGWGTVTINADESIVIPIIIGVGTVFLFEALPEELLFRGYIYSNLNIRYKRWLSGLMTIGLFVLLPVILVPLQKYLLGMEISVGGSTSITVSYIITMLFFGAFVQYLRILTNSIWTGIGFHLVFVYINRLMGVEPTRLIQFSDFTSEVPAQITFVSALAATFVILLLYPRLTKRKIGWGQRQEHSSTNPKISII